MTIPQIIATVASAFGITPEAILSAKRDMHLVLPRHVAMTMSREYTDETLTRIARAFNRKDHNAICHAVESITNRVREDVKLAATVGTIRATIVSEMSATDRMGRAKGNVLRSSLGARMQFGKTGRFWGRVNRMA